MCSQEIKATVVRLVADDGKVFSRVADGEVLGPELWLGSEDRPDNYQEIDYLEPETEEQK